MILNPNITNVNNLKTPCVGGKYQNCSDNVYFEINYYNTPMSFNLVTGFQDYNTIILVFNYTANIFYRNGYRTIIMREGDQITANYSKLQAILEFQDGIVSAKYIFTGESGSSTAFYPYPTMAIGMNI